jgi:hypothetical protein
MPPGDAVGGSRSAGGAIASTRWLLVSLPLLLLSLLLSLMRVAASATSMTALT